MDGFKILKKVLDRSIEKNGDQPITLSHLSNILGMIIDKDDDLERRLQEGINEHEDDVHRYGGQ